MRVKNASKSAFWSIFALADACLLEKRLLAVKKGQF
jgi:hypothetical protein